MSHFCSYCDYKRHVESQHEGVCYSYNYCDFKATTKGHLKIHVESLHEGVRYSCNQCDHKDKATQKVHLKKHVESLHEGVRYSCNRCDFKTVGKTTLNKHNSRHHQEHV